MIPICFSGDLARRHQPIANSCTVAHGASPAAANTRVGTLGWGEAARARAVAADVWLLWTEHTRTWTQRPLPALSACARHVELSRSQGQAPASSLVAVAHCQLPTMCHTMCSWVPGLPWRHVLLVQPADVCAGDHVLLWLLFPGVLKGRSLAFPRPKQVSVLLIFVAILMQAG